MFRNLFRKLTKKQILDIIDFLEEESITINDFTGLFIDVEAIQRLANYDITKKKNYLNPEAITLSDSGCGCCSGHVGITDEIFNIVQPVAKDILSRKSDKK